MHYGYKGHFLVCAISKLIMSVFPTTAKVHDAKVVDKYLHWGKDKQKGELLFFADAGYVGKAIEEKLRKREMGDGTNPLSGKNGMASAGRGKNVFDLANEAMA